MAEPISLKKTLSNLLAMDANSTYYNDSPYTAVTATSDTTLLSFPFVSKTGRICILADFPLQTSRYTSHIKLFVNSSEKAYATTNQTTPDRVPIYAVVDVPKDATSTINFIFGGQDTGTTATVPAYHARSVVIFDLLGKVPSNTVADNSVDYIVEEGTDGIWTWRKWSNGTAECWGVWSGTLSHYTTVFGGYGYTTVIQFPTGLFIEVPIPTYSARVGNGFALTGTLTGNISASQSSFYAVGAASGSQSVMFYMDVKGRWK